MYINLPPLKMLQVGLFYLFMWKYDIYLNHINFVQDRINFLYSALILNIVISFSLLANFYYNFFYFSTYTYTIFIGALIFLSIFYIYYSSLLALHTLPLSSLEVYNKLIDYYNSTSNKKIDDRYDKTYYAFCISLNHLRKKDKNKKNIIWNHLYLTKNKTNKYYSDDY